MFSQTLRSPKRPGCWCITAMPAREASSGDQLSAGRPSIKTAPPSGWCTPARSLTQVLLPAPFSPRSASTSPATRSKVTSRIAITPPNRFVADASPAGDSARALTAPPLDKVADIAARLRVDSARRTTGSLSGRLSRRRQCRLTLLTSRFLSQSDLRPIGRRSAELRHAERNLEIARCSSSDAGSRRQSG